MQAASEQRRYPRFDVAIPCTLRLREGPLELVTSDVSRHGAYLRTDSPRPERELIQILFRTPSEEIQAMCMVVRAYPQGGPGARGPGMGVDFFAISKEAKDRWDAFVSDVKIRGAERAVGTPPPRAPVEREHARHRACFLVRMADKSRLRDFLSGDINQGGMFLRTPVLRAEGDAVELILVHPETREEFHLGGTVVRQVKNDDPKRCGLGIRFEALTGERLQALIGFIETGVLSLKSEDPLEARVQEAVTAAQRAPDDPALQRAAGSLLRERRDLAGALTYLTRALLLTPDDRAVHAELASTHRGLGDERRAAAFERVARALG